MQARCQEATDPVDKVYALRGMAKDAHRLTIPVDYTLSTISVYTETTCSLMKGNLVVLLMAPSPARPVGVSSQQQPSWIPHFTTPPCLIDHHILIYYADFATIPYKLPKLLLSEEKDALILTVDCVAVITSALLAGSWHSGNGSREGYEINYI
jgi:hypothetical protein